MIYRCPNCNAVIDEEEVREVQEPRGEFWGIPCSETMYCCPICGNEVEEDNDYEI